jgi:cytoskeletal protein CcmA (bactofilin family)
MKEDGYRGMRIKIIIRKKSAVPEFLHKEIRSRPMKRSFRLLIFFFFCFWPAFNGAAFAFDWGNFLVGDRVVAGRGETKESDFTVAGADVEFSGKAQKDLTAFGASVVHSGEVEGDMLALGAQVTLAGIYHGRVRAGAANLVLSGTFDHDVAAAAAKITVAPSAVIKGNLRYTAATLERKEGARIEGMVARRGFHEREEWMEKGKKALAGLWLAYWLFSIPALIIVGVLVHYLSPRGTEEVLSRLSRFPWKSIGIGLVFIVVVPVAVIIAMATLVGIPAGIITLVIYALFLYVSRVFAGVWMGRKILGFFKKSWAEAFLGPLILGTLIISLLLAIPIVGWFFWLLFVFLGVGATWQAIWEENRRQRQRPPPESQAVSGEVPSPG